jgi:hypothetical protein
LVELMEYLLVFGVTAALAGFSVMTFSGFLPALHQTQGQSEVEQLAGAAELAAQNGSATIILPLANATVSCSAGLLSLQTAGMGYSSSIGAACAFRATGLNGLCKLVFARTETGVTMEVQG